MGIKEAVRALAKTGEEVYSVLGKVVSVDGYTCEVEPLDGSATIQDVRFKADVDQEDGLAQEPKVDSVVVVTFLGKNTGYVGLGSELKKVTLVVDETTFRVDGNGMHLSNGQTVFKDQVNDLITVLDKVIEALKAFKVMTPSGPSTNVMPDSLAAVVAQELALTKVKEGFEKILA